MNDNTVKKEKVYTLKNVKAEMEKIKKSRDKKKEKVKELNAEIKADSAKLKELEGIYQKLYNDSLQRQVADVWFKEQKLSSDQIAKFIELSKVLGDKIDGLEVDEIVEAISLIEPKKDNSEEKVDTYINNDRGE
jgi:septal ring factor EnvC (AmiA/AmiB activator)